MKKTVVVLLAWFVAILPSISQHLYPQKGETLHVFAVSGLNLRAEPAKTGKVLVKIPYADKVTIIELSSYEKEAIEDRNGLWVKVQYKTQTGYLFSGYLTRWKPPVTKAEEFVCGEFYEFQKWVEKNLKKDTLMHHGEKVFHGIDRDEKDSYGFDWNFYSGGTMTYIWTGYEVQHFVVESFDIGFNDLLNFLAYYQIIYDNKCKNHGEMKIRLEKQEGYRGVYKLECNYPREISATQVGKKIIIEVSLWDL